MSIFGSVLSGDFISVKNTLGKENSQMSAELVAVPPRAGPLPPKSGPEAATPFKIGP